MAMARRVAAIGSLAMGTSLAWKEGTWCASSPAGVTPAFDPEALERGAKALREINASPHAKRVLDLTKQQETTKQQEMKTKEAEYQAAAAQYSVEKEKTHWEEQRKTMQQNAQQKAQLAQYEDELARKRAQGEHDLRRQRNAEMVRMQEESSERQEALRRKTEESIQAQRRATEQQAAELEKEKIRARALAEAEGRIAEGRQNEDVRRRELLAKGELETKKAIEVVNATFSQLGAAANALLGDREKLALTVGGFTALALGVYGAREGWRVTGTMLERYLGQPPLIRETSRGMPWKRAGFGGNKHQLGFQNVVLRDRLHERVRHLGGSIANTKSRNAPFQHILFYGPPGTGKTLVARQLAQSSGLDFAILSGGDVAPLGTAAVTEIHKVFDWAKTSKRGLMLFIDEADAFLRRRGDAQMSENLRSSLNALLARTGSQTKDFVMVLASNRPSDLDSAVLDRVDEVIEFPLPGFEERERMIKMYLEKYIYEAGASEGGMFRKSVAQPLEVEGIDEEVIANAATETEGFSGREIAKMLVSLQSAGYGSKEGKVTRRMFEEIVKEKVEEHHARILMKDGTSPEKIEVV